MSPHDPVWTRIILHGDMDAFFAAVEQRDRPELKGKPVVVGGTGARGVVSTASYEARRFGIRSAMPMAHALRRCPDAVVLPPDFSRYQAVSAQINAVFQSLSPLVEPLSLDEAFIDMTGAEQLFGTPKEMAERLKRDVREATNGLTISVGVSNTKYTAKVASDFQKPDGLTLVPEAAVRDFLHPLPVRHLWGVGERSRQILESKGFRTIGDVARSSPERMTQLLGALGTRVRELADGIDPREVIPERDAKSIGKEYTLESDIRGKAAVIPILQVAADKVARSLRKQGLQASGIRIKLKTADFKLLSRQATLHRPTDSAPPLFQSACALLDRMPLTAPFRLVGLAAFHLEAAGRPVQGTLFDDPTREKQHRLDRALDAVRDKFGDPALQRGNADLIFSATAIQKNSGTEEQ